MIINKCFAFIFLISSLVSAQSTESLKSGNALTNISKIVNFADKSFGKQSCWNGLGFCDTECGINDSNKIDYSCEEPKACCVPKKVVVPIKSIDESKDPSEENISCGLNHGICQVKCLPPTTVYRGSYNECPQRHFCCIKNPVSQISNNIIQ